MIGEDAKRVKIDGRVKIVIIIRDISNLWRRIGVGAAGLHVLFKGVEQHNNVNVL